MSVERINNIIVVANELLGNKKLVVRLILRSFSGYHAGFLYLECKSVNLIIVMIYGVGETFSQIVII